MSIRYFLAAGIVAVTMVAKMGQTFLPEETKIVRYIPMQQKAIALTFDDGPHPKTTPAILKVLKEKDVKATFFMLGENVQQYPDLAAQVAQAGHEIGSHAYTHRYLKDLSRETCAKELDDTEQLLEKIAARPQLFRPPGGLFDDAVLAEAEQRGYTMILWSVDPTDWKRPGVKFVVETVLKKARAGGIILLHDGLYPLPTPQAIGQIIDRLRARGYVIVTVGDLLQYEEAQGAGRF